MIAWDDIQQALVEWVGSDVATGLGEKVIWARQSAMQPQLPYATLKIHAVRQIGYSDGILELFDATRPLGKEIELRKVGCREFLLEVQVFSKGTFGADSALALLSQLQTSLNSSEVLEAFDEAGFCLVDTETDVLDVGTLLETSFQGRASLEIRFRTTDEISDFVGYIDSADVVDDLET